MKESKNRKTKMYTVEEKNKIIEEYLSGSIGYYEAMRKYGLSSSSMITRWRQQYEKYGTTTNNTGKATKKGLIKGRPKKIKPDEMSREDLIQYVTAVEDVKKSMAYLKKQKKNI
ncbi:MAG: transposase [Clostridia bacterium]|nr:transposase [Clostridia bacterium]MDD4375963.1 transposase [Clostridia bacterium]